jgi:hypothetical protein
MLISPYYFLSYSSEVAWYCLGIYFGHNEAECKKINTEKQLLKSEKIMNSWKKRNITMVGKIMIVKSAD